MKRRQRRWLLLQPRWRGCWPYLHRSQPTAWCAAEKKGLRCWIRERVANNSQTRCAAADGRGGGGGGTGNHLTDISTCSTTSSLFISAVSLHSIRFVKQQQPSAHFPFISSSYRIYFFFFFFFSCRQRHHQSRSNNNKRWNWKSERLLESIPFTVVWLRHCSCSYPAGRQLAMLLLLLLQSVRQPGPTSQLVLYRHGTVGGRESPLLNLGPAT